jgi:hypothetical protein
LQFSSAKKIEHSSIAAVSTTPRDIANNGETYISDFARVHQTLRVTSAMEAEFQITPGRWRKLLIGSALISTSGGLAFRRFGMKLRNAGNWQTWRSLQSQIASPRLAASTGL